MSLLSTFPREVLKNRITGEHDCQAYFKTTSLLTSQLQHGAARRWDSCPFETSPVGAVLCIAPFLPPGPLSSLRRSLPAIRGATVPASVPSAQARPWDYSLLDMVTLFSVPGSRGSPLLYRKPRGLHARPTSLRTWLAFLGFAFHP